MLDFCVGKEEEKQQTAKIDLWGGFIGQQNHGWVKQAEQRPWRMWGILERYEPRVRALENILKIKKKESRWRCEAHWTSFDYVMFTAVRLQTSRWRADNSLELQQIKPVFSGWCEKCLFSKHLAVNSGSLKSLESTWNVFPQMFLNTVTVWRSILEAPYLFIDLVFVFLYQALHFFLFASLNKKLYHRLKRFVDVAAGLEVNPGETQFVILPSVSGRNCECSHRYAVDRMSFH